jgi:selenocysteine-specific elongation factor
VVFRREDYLLMLEKIQGFFQARKTATLADVRDLLGTSRKYVQALLEYLDEIGITVRDGDSRHLKT